MEYRRVALGQIIRSREAGHVLNVDMATPAGTAHAHETRFRQWREEKPDGSVACGAGTTPRDWAAPDEPAPCSSDTDIAAAHHADHLSRFLAFLGTPATVRYSRLVSRRDILDPAGVWRSRFLDVFALTGRIGLADGRFMSIGWSGFGNGLDRLVGGAMRDRLAWIARTAGTAASMEAGSEPAVLAPQPAALVAHEAIGHFCEAAVDLDLRHRLGVRLAADGFDAYDDPLFAGAARYAIDDEGTEPIGATRVLENGVVVQQLHSRRSAAAMATLPTGHARSAQITQPPVPRLSNLIVPPGSQPLEALLDTMGSGLLVHHLSHGFSRGIEIEARIVLAERIEGGRRTGRYVSGGRLRERIDVLTRCTDRGDTSELNPNALCGKYGQILYDVGTTAPALLLSSFGVAA